MRGQANLKGMMCMQRKLILSIYVTESCFPRGKYITTNSTNTKYSSNVHICMYNMLHQRDVTYLQKLFNT